MAITDDRKSWSDYYLRIAREVATRATCDRKHVGAVIVSKDNRIIATGYNGSLPGWDHCTNAGHLMRDGHCVRTAHAECNAIASAAAHGVKLRGSRIYCTALPCWPCMKMIVSVGIKHIIFAEAYRPDEEIMRMLKEAGVRLTHREGVLL